MIVEGEKITLTATFSDNNGTVTDPSTPVTVTVKKPDGTKDADAEEATKDDTGIFSYEYTTSDPGTYNYKFESADNSIEQDSFKVKVDKTQ